MLRLRGSWPTGGSTLGRWPVPAQSAAPPPLPSAFAIRGLGFSRGRWRVVANLPGRCCHRLWVPLSPAPLLLWGFGLRRWRVPRAVAPVDEGCAQGPGQPDIGLRIRDAEYAPPPPGRQATLAPGRATPPKLRPGGPLRGPPRPPSPPGGTSGFPSSRQRSMASKGWYLMYPEVGQFSHPYTPSTRGRVSPPRGSRTASQSRTQSLRALAGRGAHTAPPAGSAPGSCATGAAAIRAGSAPSPRGAGAAARRAGSASGSQTAGLGFCGASPCWPGGGWRGTLGGPGGDQGPKVGVSVVDGQGVVVVGVVPRHPLDAGGDAPHRLDLRLRGLPACLSLPFALPVPSGPWAPPSLSTVARVAPPLLAPGPLPCLLPLAPARPLPPALPMSLTVPRAPPTAAGALAFPVRLPSPAAACSVALPLLLPPSAAANALALPLCLPPPSCCPRLCRFLVPAPLLRRLPPSHGCLPSLALCVCALHLAPCNRRLLPGPLGDLPVPRPPCLLLGPRDVAAAAA